MANGPVLVVDFGAQYAQLIARRVREAGVYSELVPHSMPVDEILAKDPKAIILSGGPASVFEPGAPTIDTKVFESGVPVLGICYGFQVMAYELGGKVDKAALGEYGKTSATIDDAAGILADSPAEQTTWMSHGVAVEQAPAGFEVLAHTEGAPVAAMADESRKLYGVQWHPEVKHSPLGQKLIENFLHRCAALPNDWDASSIIEDQVKKIREQVGDAEVICGLSGGVDSAVAAALPNRLAQWPCQIKLVPAQAPYYQGRGLLIAADCTAFACASFHERFMSGNVTIIGCPKLDEGSYTDKLAAIIAANDITSVTVARMEVPCCGGLERAAAEACAQSGKDIPFEVITFAVNGDVID